MDLDEQFAQSVNQSTSQQQLTYLILGQKTQGDDSADSFWPPDLCCSLPSQEYGEHSPDVHRGNTRSDDLGNRSPRPLTALEPWDHSIILTPQRQNGMKRKGTNPKSSNQGYQEGHGDRGLWYIRNVLCERGQSSLKKRYLRKHMIWCLQIWDMFMDI